MRRQEVGNTFGNVIEKMLTKKLPKLVKAQASKRVLLLERQHLNLLPESIHEEIEKRRAMFPKLADVDEIWIIDNIPFFQNNDGDARFELWESRKLARSFEFQGGKLLTQSKQKMAVTIRRLLEPKNGSWVISVTPSGTRLKAYRRLGQEGNRVRWRAG